MTVKELFELLQVYQNSHICIESDGFRTQLESSMFAYDGTTNTVLIEL